MSYPQKHIIQRLALEVEINTEYADGRQAETWLNFVRDWVYSTLLPMLEEILDKMPLSNEIIRLDQLKLDVGELSEIHLKNFTSESGIQIKQAIEEKVRAVQADQKFKRLREGQNTVEAFFFFLKTGHLPWWFTPRPRPEWESQILVALAEYTGNPATVFKDTAVCQRLAVDFSKVFFEEIIRKLFSKFYEKIVETQEIVKKIITTANFSLSKRKEVEYVIRETLLHFLGQELLVGQLPMYVVSHLPKKEFLLLRKAANALAVTNRKSEEEKRFIELLATKEEQSKKIKFVINQEAVLPEHSQNEKKTTEEIYVSNAGLVLLHPFINYFFEELKLSKNGKLIRPQRATYLLQWLANGQSNSPEYELPLNKLLCGIPAESPIVGKLKLTKREKNEAQNLLEAVVRHWDVLKNTSPAGLQGNFLCREGKLTQKQDGDWLLQIEGKSIDILLADLPWSISMIQLPWMPHWLWVEWA